MLLSIVLVIERWIDDLDRQRIIGRIRLMIL